nr:Fic family protein [Variovorax paradoxus]
MAQLQEAILGKTTTLPAYGLRRSPVYVGQTVRYENVVHYFAPPWEAVPRMVDALSQFLIRTEGAPSVMRAAVASFGFVYIHPLSDGNGRVHRFLINDILRRDGAVHAPFILPVSALITDSTLERANYDRALEAFSKPFMGRFAEASSFRREPVAQPDGVLSNFEFAAYDEAMPAWRFIDLTSHVEYMSGVIDRTIRKEMHSQAAFFRAHDQARQELKEIIEGPDAHLDMIIRSIRHNEGRLSNKLRGQFPQLGVPGVWEQVARVVDEAFAVSGGDPFRPDVDLPRGDS